jgi:flagellar hook-basal body complex protein FliE
VPLQDDEDDAAPMPLVANGLDSAIENKQRLENLRGAFHGLSESHHKLIVMRELEGLSYDQIGERMGMTKPVVESQLFRARKRLGEEYDELVSGRRCEHVQSVIAHDGERPLRTLGIRERRQFARHLAHCQPCRRHARMAGVDEQFFHVPGLAAKLAALFPFPFLRWRRGRGRSGGDEAAAAGSSHTIAALQSLPVVARLADPSSPVLGLSRAGAAVAALVIAAAGGGFVAGVEHGASSRHATPANSAPARGAIATAAARAIHVTPAVAGGGGSVPPRVRKPTGGSGGGGGGAGHGGSGGSGGSAWSGSQSGGGSRSSAGGALGSVGSTVQGVSSGGGSNSLGQVVTGASNTLNQASQGASNAVNQATQGASGAVNQVTQGASNAVNQARQGASSAVNQVTQGAANTVNHVTSGATNAASNTASSVGNTLGNLTHP